MKHENDPTLNMAGPALIVTGPRTGGTFLAHSLSNHPQVFCDRGEPLHHNSPWMRHLAGGHLPVLECLTHMVGYRVSMCKLLYLQAFEPAIWPYLVDLQPRVIHLIRANRVRQAVSLLLNMRARLGQIDWPQHTFGAVTPPATTLPAEVVLDMARDLEAQEAGATQMLEAMQDVLLVAYADLAGGERAEANILPKETAHRICHFLGVRPARLTCELRRVNARPLRETLVNWPEIEAAIAGSEFADCLEDERHE
ncbi:MAG: hypothetical protein PHQ60_15670 [Sideroxydans sp.]|nr:hypothetical protein [Sideroxydans sp.]